MRKKLKTLEEERKRFTGIFRKFGSRRTYTGGSTKTVLVEQIREVGVPEVLSDHAWLNYTQSFADAGFLKDGDVIEFDARVKLYTKGYVNRHKKIDRRQEDYRFSHPTDVRRVEC